MYTMHNQVFAQLFLTLANVIVSFIRAISCHKAQYSSLQDYEQYLALEDVLLKELGLREDPNKQED